MDAYTVRMIAAFAIAKGVAIAVVATLLDIEFLRALVIAGVSGVIGAGGAIVAAVIATRATAENREAIHESHDDLSQKITERPTSSERRP